LLCKLVFYWVAIKYFIVEQVGVVGVINLFGNRGTSAVPAVPQSDVFVKCWVNGKNNLVC